MTVDRLRELLDAYGASPTRWPEAERASAQKLVAESAAARELQREADALDRLLDALPAGDASPALVSRVLGGAPGRRARRATRWVAAAALPLAAAAALGFWLLARQKPASPTADARQKPASPTADVANVRVGEYGSSTDVLLQTYGVDVYATVPSVGCADSALGCPRVEAPDGSRSEAASQGKRTV